MTTSGQNTDAYLTGDPLAAFPFASAWANNSSEAQDFLPAFDALLQDRLDFLESQPTDIWTSEDINELKEYNSLVGNGHAADMIAKLGHQNTLAVVTGQQPNFLVSPMYILYKALTAIAHSRELSDKLARPVVPIFWIASDDDDFAELRQAWLISGDGNLIDIGKQISRGKTISVGAPAYMWDLSDSLERIEKTLQTIFEKTLNGIKIRAFITEALNQHTNFEHFFANLLTKLLGPKNPMIFVAPRLNAMRRRQIQILLRELKQPGIATEAVNIKSTQLQNLNFGSILTRDSSFLNFFMIENNVRHRLVLEGTTVHVEEPKKHRRIAAYTINEMEELVEGSPEKFTPNVITRPYVQDYGLPTLAYIAGPGEISYLAQVRAAATVFGIMPSAIQLRTFVTITPQNSINIITQSQDDTTSWLLANDCSSHYLNSVAELRKNANTILSEIANDKSYRCSTIDKATKKTIEHINYGLDQYLKRIGKQLNYSGWLALRTADHLLRPRGSNQERTLSPFNFINPNSPHEFSEWLTQKVTFTHPASQYIYEWPPNSPYESTIPVTATTNADSPK